MVLGYHVIFTMYGFWLPNDPRGSWSDYVRSLDLLKEHGSATKTNSRRSVAYVQHDVAARERAKKQLKYPPVVLDGMQARAVARGFADAAQQSGYVIWACAILPDHVHLVIARHARLRIERIVGHLKSAATLQLFHEERHPLIDHADEKTGKTPSPWSAKTGWTVYLNSVADIERCIRYTEANPVKDGLKPQRWNFVTPFDPASLRG